MALIVLRAGFALAAFFLLATPTRPGPVPERPSGPFAMLTVRPLTLDEDDPQRRRVGQLDFLAGWELSSDDLRFGGISAMHVENGQVLAVSDAGTLFSLAVPSGPRARVRLESVREGPGTGADKADRDAEAMLVHGNQAWIAFEARNQVWRYARQSWRAEAGTAPDAMRRLPGNSGSEAMVRMPDGYFLILSEGPVRGGLSPALLFEGDPAIEGTGVRELRYRAPAGYRPTDAALLPDGRVLILNRRFSYLEGVSAKLVIADGASAQGIIEGREIANLTTELNIDNMEALSVTREGKRTIVWIASDDNFSPLQRSLLLKFALRP